MKENTPSRVEELVRLARAQARSHALLLLDLDGNIVDWMGGAETIFGYSREEILGRDFSLLFTPEDQRVGLHRLELEIAHTSGEAEDDRWQVRKDGSRFWASGAVTPLKDRAGKTIAFFKILRNRSDTKIRIETLEKRLAALELAHKRKDNTLSAFAHD